MPAARRPSRISPNNDSNNHNNKRHDSSNDNIVIIPLQTEAGGAEDGKGPKTR